MKLWHKLIPSKGSGIFCWLHKPCLVRTEIHKTMQQVTQTDKAKSVQNSHKHGAVTQPSPSITGVSGQCRCAGVTPENPPLDPGLQRHKNKLKSNTDGSGSSLAYTAGWTYSSEPFLPLECWDTEAVLLTGKKYVIQLFIGSSWSVSTVYLNWCCSFCLTLKVF